MLRYFRSLLPFLLACLGYALVAFVWTRPFLQWRIDGIVTDIPSNYQVNIRPLWTTRFGEALLDAQRFGLGDVSVVRSAAPFSDNCGSLDLVVNRSQQDEQVEQRWLKTSRFFEIYQSTWGWLEIVLAGIYIWLCVISRERRPTGHAITLTIVAVTFACILLMAWQSAFSSIYRHHNLADDCQGTITLTATISQIYFGALAPVLAGLCLQAAAVVLMLRMMPPKRGKPA